MIKYILKRLGMAVVTIVLLICITYMLMNIIPGGPFLSEKAVSPKTIEMLNKKYGLDQPLPVQIKNYMVKAVQGDFGVSLKMQKNRPVTTIIMEMFPVSAKIGIITLVWAVLVGIPLGCIAAYHRGSALDSILRILTTVGVAVPGFVLATVLSVTFAGGVFKIFPTTGLTEGWKSYVLPCFSLGFYPMCYMAKLTRSSMLDVINQDYIRTARAKGLSTKLLIFKHALRNSVIPVMSYFGTMAAFILTGGFVVETVFNIPGLGRYLVQSISNRDYPIIMGTTIFLGALIIVINLVVDILYTVVDPRIHLTKGE